MWIRLRHFMTIGVVFRRFHKISLFSRLRNLNFWRILSIYAVKPGISAFQNGKKVFPLKLTMKFPPICHLWMYIFGENCKIATFFHLNRSLKNHSPSFIKIYTKKFRCFLLRRKCRCQKWSDFYGTKICLLTGYFGLLANSRRTFLTTITYQ